MSRIGFKEIIIPEGVEVKVDGQNVTVKGKNGTMNVHIPSILSLDMSEEGKIFVRRPNDEKISKQHHGTTRALLNDAIVGVSEGFTKTLEIVGIGYRASMRGNDIVLEVGHSHEIVISPEKGSEIRLPKPTRIEVFGYDKQAVGQTAANIRAVRKPEPYLGKGIKYSDEHIIRKEGKRAVAKK
ncbi:MAG: 50S ribosomal protein L6 [Bacilli bacterium]|jgi:large subunit ribosomal protein L6